MAITGSGQVSLSDIQTEFGGSNPIGLSEYYGEGNAPASGEIQLATDFYGTSSATEGHTLIATATASSSSTLAFTSGIDSTYDVYQFHFANMHPATNGAKFSFQVNAAGQTGFNETMTTTTFMAYHGEDASYGRTDYSTGDDQGQGTAYQTICPTASNANDAAMSGLLTLHAPSSTTYVKQFTVRTSVPASNGLMYDFYTAGYINVTAAIDEISFMFHSGNIDAGVIKMHGIAKA